MQYLVIQCPKGLLFFGGGQKRDLDLKNFGRIYLLEWMACQVLYDITSHLSWSVYCLFQDLLDSWKGGSSFLTGTFLKEKSEDFPSFQRPGHERRRLKQDHCQFPFSLFTVGPL